MQNSDLMIIFPQDEKEGVHELDEFGEVVPPEHTYDLERRKQVLQALHTAGASNSFADRLKSRFCPALLGLKVLLRSSVMRQPQVS